jgi:Ca2+-binding RTX toxin-like protein
MKDTPMSGTTAMSISFDNGLGSLGNAYGVDQSVAGQVTLAGNSALMEWASGPSSGHGYGTYTIQAQVNGNQPGPAIILWPGDNNWPGQEIDMMEITPNGSGQQYGTVHWSANGSDAYTAQIFYGVTAWTPHSYQMVWEPGLITFKVDGVVEATVNSHVPVDFAHGGMNDTIGFLNNNSNTSITVYQVDYAPLGTTAPAPVTHTPATLSAGSGSDHLVLKVSEDAYNGDAQYTVKVDGTQVGGTFTAAALYGSGDDTLTLSGNWGGNAHSVVVNFLNDAWGGTATTDRNLYVDAASYNGTALPNGSASLLSAGPVSIAVPASATHSPASLSAGSGSDQMVIKLSEDAYNGDAQYTVKVDGTQVGGTFTASALHGSGDDTLTLSGSWGTGAHTVTVNFLNDAWGGTATTDRNLYVDGISYNGHAASGGNLLSAGPVNFGIAASGTTNTGTLPTPANGGKLIQGSSSADQLTGTGGDDVIVGGKGNDGMTGGGGADSFVLAQGDGPDWINDFNAGTDHLVFQGIAKSTVTTNLTVIAGSGGLDIHYGTAGDEVFLAGVWKLGASDMVFA